jgi:hypothetical protein
VSVARSLLLPLLLSSILVSPARSQDGQHDAAAAQDAAQALGLYLDGVTRSGGQPDYTKPPAAPLFDHVFDLKALAALPPAQADDMGWLLAWGTAVDQTYKRILLFGLKPDQAADRLLLQRNITQYEDQCAAAMDFMIRFEARQAATLSRFLDQLPQEERTPGRAAGLQQARLGATQLIVGAIVSVSQGMKPANARLVSGALRDTRDTWALYIPPSDRGGIIGMVGQIPQTTDGEVRKNLTAFADALTAANERKETP